MLTYSISKGAFCSSVAGRCDDSRGQKIVSSHLWPCGSHASRSEWSIASAASSSVLFGCRRWNRAKKVDPLSALGRLRTYVPHGEIGALRATFLGERRIVSADPRPDKAQFQDRQSAEPCATPVAGLICDSQFSMSYKSRSWQQNCYLCTPGHESGDLCLVTSPANSVLLPGGQEVSLRNGDGVCQCFGY